MEGRGPSTVRAPGSGLSHGLSLLTLLYSLISILSENFNSFFIAKISNFHETSINTMIVLYCKNFMIHTSSLFSVYSFLKGNHT